MDAELNDMNARPSMAMLQPCADQEGVCLGACAHFFFACERFTRITHTHTLPHSYYTFVPIASAQRMIHGREIDVLNVAYSGKLRAGASDEIDLLLTLPCTFQDIIAEIKGRREHGSSGN